MEPGGLIKEYPFKQITQKGGFLSPPCVIRVFLWYLRLYCSARTPPWVIVKVVVPVTFMFTTPAVYVYAPTPLLQV
jgi:hypothetical protein